MSLSLPFMGRVVERSETGWGSVDRPGRLSSSPGFPTRFRFAEAPSP